MLYIQLGLAALGPAIVSAVFYQCNKTTGFSKLSVKAKQVIYGFVFGLLAILSTEFGSQCEGCSPIMRRIDFWCAVRHFSRLYRRRMEIFCGDKGSRSIHKYRSELYHPSCGSAGCGAAEVDV